MMICPCCGNAELVSEARDYPYTYKGESTVITAVEGDHCPSCGEAILDREHGDRFSRLIGEFQKRVNSDLVDPAFIANVRKKLELDQREAGELFGGGVNAFSRYENGRTKPPVALVKLLKLLEKHPDLIKDLRAS